MLGLKWRCLAAIPLPPKKTIEEHAATQAQFLQTNLEPLLAARQTAPLLVDCLSLWLTAAMDDCGAWDDATWAAGGEAELRSRTAGLVSAWRSTPRRVVAVSNEVGSGVVPATASGRRFRDTLGELNQRLAATADEVWLVTAGIPRRLR